MEETFSSAMMPSPPNSDELIFFVNGRKVSLWSNYMNFCIPGTKVKLIFLHNYAVSYFFNLFLLSFSSNI